MLLWLVVAGTLAASGTVPVNTPVDVPVSGDLTPALARESAGDSEGALAEVLVIMRAWPSAPLPRLEAARLLLKLGGDLEQVRAHLDVAAQGAPDNPRLHYLRGLLFEEQAEPRLAAQAYERAVALRSTYEEARFRLGGVWAAQGDWLKAEMHYRLLARARPEWVQVRLQLIQVIEKQGRVADAERELMLLKGEQPGNVQVLNSLAAFYERTGRPRLAAQVRAAAPAPAPAKKMRPLRPSRR
jgi:tetratricopeptide (TPR) repeat protein